MRFDSRLWFALVTSAALSAGCAPKTSKSGDQTAPAPEGGHQAENPPAQPQSPGAPESPAASPQAPEAPPEVPPERAAACATAWQKHVGTYKAGLETTYRITTRTTAGSAAPSEASRQVHSTVTAVGPDSLTYDVAQKALTPAESPEKVTTVKKTKDMFLADCAHGLTAEDDESVKIELLGQANEKLTVAAGAFDTVHATSKETGTDEDDTYQCDHETWTLAGPATDLQIFAKTVDHCVQQMNGAPFVQDQTSELVSLKLP